MACLYCGGDVPLRMRLTGEDRFCCPEHKRLYNEEHTRLGLARLLEEAGTKGGPAPQPAAAPQQTEAAAEAEADPNALPEPELVSSGGGLRLWLFPHLPHRPAPRFQKFLAPDSEPVAYAPAVQEAPPAAEPAPVEASPAPAGETRGIDVQASAAVEEPPVRRPEAKPARPAEPAEEERKQEKPAGERRPAAEPKPKPETKAEENKDSKKDAASEEIPLPAFEGYQESSGRSWLRVAAGLVLALAAGGGYYWYHNSPGPVQTPAVADAGSGLWQNWIPNWARSAGGEEIALFGPSLGWTDYRVQWRANPNEEVAWVYRAADPHNYYVLRLELTRYGTWKVVRYALIDGRRTNPEERILSQQLPEERRVAVQLEVRGSEFRLYVDGHNVASWQDERLKRGGFGVMRPDAGLAGLGNVTVTELRGNSVQEGRFWRKLRQDRMPEVTLLGRRSDPPSPRRAGAEESEL